MCLLVVQNHNIHKAVKRRKIMKVEAVRKEIREEEDSSNSIHDTLRDSFLLWDHQELLV